MISIRCTDAGHFLARPGDPHCQCGFAPSPFRAEGDDVEIKDQPAPDGGWGNVQALVRGDLEEREQVGTQRYGRPLQLFNGRNAMVDAYQEVLDLACYLRQHLAEQETLETADSLVPPKALVAAQHAVDFDTIGDADSIYKIVHAAAPFIAAAASSRPPLDELEFIDGRPIVHSHVGDPCSRCGAIDLHTLDQCGQWTRQVMAGQPRAATRIVDDPLPRRPEPASDAAGPAPTLDAQASIIRTYWCDNESCVMHAQRITVQVLRVGHFVDLPVLRCRSCGCEALSEALDWMRQSTSTRGF